MHNDGSLSCLRRIASLLVRKFSRIKSAEFTPAYVLPRFRTKLKTSRQQIANFCIQNPIICGLLSSFYTLGDHILHYTPSVCLFLCPSLACLHLTQELLAIENHKEEEKDAHFTRVTRGPNLSQNVKGRGYKVRQEMCHSLNNDWMALQHSNFVVVLPLLNATFR